MKYDFDTRVERRGRGNLKALCFTPPHILEGGFVSYAGAEFEFKTARPVIDAVKEAAENGLFGFTVADAQYFSHVTWWLRQVRQAEVAPEWVLPVQGTIFSVATAIRLLTGPGEGVVIPVPSYNRYQQAVVRLGRRAVFSPMREAGEGLELDMEDLERKLEENRLLILCNPNNPTGRILRREALQQVLALARKNGAAVLCDEIFADIVFGEEPVPLLTEVAGEEDLAVSVVSLGKTFSFTGVNHANAIIRNPALRAQFAAQRDADHFGSIDPMVYAALCGGYSPAGKEWLLELIEVVRRNNEALCRFFARHLPAVQAAMPEASYVLWLDFTGLGLGEEELFRFLEEEACFCCDRGKEYYGRPCQARLSTAVPQKELERSLGLLLEAARRRGLAK